MENNKQTLDEILRHEIEIARLATGSFKSIVKPSLEQTYKEVIALIQRRGLPNTPKQLEKLEADIAKAIQKYSGWAIFTEQLDEFAQYEAAAALQTTQSLTDATLALASKDKIAKHVSDSLLSLESGSRTNTGTWAQFVQGNTDASIKDYNNIIRTGYSRGQTLGAISKELRSITQGLLLNEAEALARTGYSHYANASREAMADGLNIDTDWIYTATFDSRTTIGCRNLDGTKYRNGKDRISLPRHFNCRSTYVILPAGEELEGLRPAVGGKGRKDDKELDPGRIRYSTSQEDWLSRQPRWFVDQSLGKKRADLFLSGKVSLSKFTDMTGKPLTLKQLGY